MRAAGSRSCTARCAREPIALELVEGLVEHFRNLLLLGIDASLRDSVALGDVHLSQAQQLAARFRTEDLLYLLNRTATLHEDVRRSPQPVLGLEAAVIEMTHFESRVVLSELLERLQDGAAPVPGGAAPSAPVAGAGRSSGAPGPAAGPGRIAAPPQSAPPAGTRRPSTPRGESTAGFEAGGMPARQLPPPAPAAVAPHGTAPLFAAGGPLPAPAPVVRPAGAIAVQAVSLQLDDVSARWSEFAHLLRETKTVLAHCIADAKPVRLASNTVELEFPLENSFQLHALQEAIKQRTLDPYLRTFFGEPLKLSIAAAAGDTGAGAAPAARLSRDDIAKSRRDAIEDVVRQTPAIDEIIQLFDGEVLEDPEV